MQHILLDRKIRKIFGALFLFVVFIILSSCHEKLYDYYNCIWKCEEPEIEISVPSKQEISDENKQISGYIMNGEDKIEIICLWKQNNGLDIFFKDMFDENQEGILFDEWIAIATNPKDYNGNKVSFSVWKDNIFDYKYKTITLTRHDL